jgi:putative tricarboxylic transport membrane protein
VSELGSPTTAHRPDWAVLAVAAVLLGLAGIVAWDANHLSGAVAAYSRVGAAAFPYGIAAALAVCGILTAVSAFRHNPVEREVLELPPLLWVICGLVAQIVLLGFAGFSIATGFLFAFTARGFGGKPLWLTIPIGIVLSFILYVIFSRGLQLSLPQGPLERLI